MDLFDQLEEISANAICAGGRAVVQALKFFALKRFGMVKVSL